MDVGLRFTPCLLVVLVTVTPAASAADPLVEVPASQITSPKATYRTYIEAIRKNDVKAAKQCWVVDDRYKSDAVDTIVASWISMRRINQVVQKRFGVEGVDALFGDLDPAIDLAKRRLADAEVKIAGDTAELKFKREDDDSTPSFAFEGGGPISFRKVDGSWKIDLDKLGWVPMHRDKVAVINEAIDRIEAGKLKTAKDLDEFIHDKMRLLWDRHFPGATITTMF